jgi:hypothetical protein
MAEALWYHEEDGKQAGPVSGAALEEAIRSGRIAPGLRVWRAGMAGWLPWDSLPELAALRQPPAPPQAPAPTPWSQPGAAPAAPPSSSPAGWGQAAPGPSGPAAWGRSAAIEPVNVALTVLLSVITFGIYGLVKFYQCGQAYGRLSPARASGFERLFWIYLGLTIGSAVGQLVFAPLGFALLVGSFVAGIFLLNEVLAARDAAVVASGARVQLTGAGTHKALWIGGSLLAVIFVGLLALMVQAVLFFVDHDRLAGALGARG